VYLGKCSDEMLADVHGYRHQLLRVGADDLLHDGGEVVVLRLPDDVEQLERDLPDLRLQILARRLALAGQHHLDGDGRLHLKRKTNSEFPPQSIYSVADPGCLSRIRLFSIPDPGSELSPSRIPDLHQRI
jgi:hypothetical protein